MKRNWIWVVLLVLAFILGLAFSAFAVSATSLSIKHNKKLPTPYELITKGKILDQQSAKGGTVIYYIAWDKTDDIYRCGLYWDTGDQLSVAKCYVSIQETKTGR